MKSRHDCVTKDVTGVLKEYPGLRGMRTALQAACRCKHKHRPRSGLVCATCKEFVPASTDTGPGDSFGTEDECAISLKADGAFNIFKLATGTKTNRFQLCEGKITRSG